MTHNERALDLIALRTQRDNVIYDPDDVVEIVTLSEHALRAGYSKQALYSVIYEITEVEPDLRLLRNLAVAGYH